MKRRRPSIEFVTTQQHVAEMFPPVPAARCVPEWWKKTPGFVPEEKRSFPHLRLRRDSTIKSCPGIADYLALGYILPLWADVLISARDDGFDYELTCKSNEIAVFAPHTLGPAFPRRPGDHTYVLKVTMPWKLRTPRGWSAMLLPPPYSEETRWSVMPGVVDSDRLPTINFIAEWHMPLGHAELLKAGLPLLHVIPFRRREHLPLAVKIDQKFWDESYGIGVNAVEGSRLAPGSYREHGRQMSQH
jgi:hypothetical protein